MSPLVQKYLDQLDNSPNLRAVVQLIYTHEGGSERYHALVGGGRFESLADHPRQRIWVPALNVWSTAAGAAQFLAKTWDGIVRDLGLADFSERNQDAGTVHLIAGRRALDDVLQGRFEQAMRKLNKEWASLPESPYGQPTLTMQRALQEYRSLGGRVAGEEAAPRSQAIADDTKESNMGFTELALGAVFNVVPKLLDLFKGGSAVAVRNTEATKVILEAAKGAVGARNEQELVEAIKANPTDAAAVREAIEGVWYELHEVAGGVAKAREFSLQLTQQPFWYNPAFAISCMLLVMPVMLLVDVFYVHPAQYDGNLRTQIVTGVLLVISMVGAFWLGTSFSSQRKTDAMASQAQGPTERP